MAAVAGAARAGRARAALTLLRHGRGRRLPRQDPPTPARVARRRASCSPARERGRPRRHPRGRRPHPQPLRTSGALPLLLFYVSRDQATTDDRWDDAVAGYTEAVGLAREAAHATDLALSLAGLAWLEARQGAADACAAHAERGPPVLRARHLGFFQAWAGPRSPSSTLAAGARRGGRRAVRPARRPAGRPGLVDVDLSPAPEMVEALVQLGRSDEAAAIAADLTRRAEVKGQPWSLARAARAAGLTARDDDVDVCFAVALAYHQHTPDTFETARTRLAYGARLRRRGAGSTPGPPCARRSTAFERLGAAPWADRAAAELRATGETAQRRSTTGLDHLTPQELQVARDARRRTDDPRGRRARCSSARRRSSTTCATSTRDGHHVPGRADGTGAARALSPGPVRSTPR